MDDMQEKINEYLNELNQDPSSKVFTKLADEYRKNGDYDQALKVVKEGMQKHPDFIKGWIVWGKVLSDAGRNGEAIEKFKKVIELNPDNLSAYLFLGKLYKKDNNHAEALNAFKQAYKLSPDDEDIEEEINDIKKQMASAPAVFEEAESTFPAYPTGPLGEPSESSDGRFSRHVLVFLRFVLTVPPSATPGAASQPSNSQQPPL